MSKQRRYPKRKLQPRIEPRRACYCITDLDVLGLEFDVKVKGQETYARLFFIPEGDRLYCWKTDRRPEKFVKVPVGSISQKRKASLLEVWNGQPSEELVTD